MTRITLLLAAAAAAALAAAGAAPAKEVSSFQICGPDACNTVTDRALITRFEESAGSYDISTGAAAPAAYYVLRVTVDTGDEQVKWENFYVPSAHVLRSVDEFGSASWRRAPKEERAVLDEVAAGVRPFPVPQITKVTVGRKTAVDPSSYLGLYRLKATPRAYPRHAGWQRIRLNSPVASPWTDGANTLRYLPTERLLERDGQYIRLSKRLARAVQRGAALRVPG